LIFDPNKEKELLKNVKKKIEVLNLPRQSIGRGLCDGCRLGWPVVFWRQVPSIGNGIPSKVRWPVVALARSRKFMFLLFFPLFPISSSSPLVVRLSFSKPVLRHCLHHNPLSPTQSSTKFHHFLHSFHLSLLNLPSNHLLYSPFI